MTTYAGLAWTKREIARLMERAATSPSPYVSDFLMRCATREAEHYIYTRQMLETQVRNTNTLYRLMALRQAHIS